MKQISHTAISGDVNARVIVALDGSGLAEHALPFAISIARRAGTRGRIELVHVHEQGVLAPNAPMNDSRWEDEGAAEMDAVVQALADRLTDETGIDVTAVTLRGPTADSLVQHAASRAADLIVMTTHGRSGFSRAWFGSVAERVIHTATVPVLVVRTGKQEQPAIVDPLFRHILIPIDRAACGAEALKRARALGTPECTTYTLLTVVKPIPVLPPPFSEPGVSIVQDDPARRTTRAIELLERLAAPARVAGAEIDVRVTADGRTAPAILEIVSESGADLIVLSIHQGGALSRGLLGSVVDKVMRGAAVPLLLFRAPTSADSPTMQGAEGDDGA